MGENDEDGGADALLAAAFERFSGFPFGGIVLDIVLARIHTVSIKKIVGMTIVVAVVLPLGTSTCTIVIVLNIFYYYYNNSSNRKLDVV